MGDRIEIRGLTVRGVHGVLAEERERSQPFVVDLDLEVDLAEAGASDQLGATVDYAAVADVAVAVIGGPTSYALLETLATAIADAALGTDPRIDAVTVSLRKTRPPLAVDVASVGVRIRRARPPGPRPPGPRSPGPRPPAPVRG
ncbi:MAG: dihydroneopterin aldolase [Actinomycetota bacterium]|nr:dihydroneopterin aldolase [Actinomycetota bacterium]